MSKPQLVSYFHSQVFSEKFPSASITASKTAMRLLSDASLSVDDVLKNREPRQFIFPVGPNLI